MGKKNKFNPDNKFTLFVKLSRRVPNSVNISKKTFENLEKNKEKILRNYEEIIFLQIFAKKFWKISNILDILHSQKIVSNLLEIYIS